MVFFSSPGYKCRVNGELILTRVVIPNNFEQAGGTRESRVYKGIYMGVVLMVDCGLYES